MPNRVSVPQAVEPLSGSPEVLYRVYLEIAAKDHRCRVQALYGNQAPPPGHTPFRPLPFHQFADRLASSSIIPQGETLFRSQLARLAGVYGVDCLAVVTGRVAA